ncbi:putative U1 small nuclear ribonucleoprotein 70 kDa [Iris pallida]|uniref:U1 small nuclear ribonucleoprotein 70 kDa n=1 Tax=Iris pallida TaxID=29817 RepID=A0AAX6GRY3_IRIPA|nr:putative U1 small nuclear ribonucleoprotein 70 kDa [Iris pallida]
MDDEEYGGGGGRSGGDCRKERGLTSSTSRPRSTATSRKTRMMEMIVRLVTDKETNKPRGYAFIEYMHTRDMKIAYKQADGRKLDNRRVFVDVERGRTVLNWRPRRFSLKLLRRFLQFFARKFRFNAEFIEMRRQALDIFINRVASHPELKQSEDLRIFFFTGI